MPFSRIPLGTLPLKCVMGVELKRGATYDVTPYLYVPYMNLVLYEKAYEPGLHLHVIEITFLTSESRP